MIRLIIASFSFLSSYILIVGIIIPFFKEDQNYTITSLSWIQLTDIHQQVTKTEQGYNLPFNARVVRTDIVTQTVKTVIDFKTTTQPVTEQIKVSQPYPCMIGKLIATCYHHEIRAEVRHREVKEPVYEDRPVPTYFYTYDVDEWLYLHTIKRTGIRSSDKLSLPEELVLEAGQKQGENITYYFVSLSKNNKVITIATNYECWINLTSNQIINPKYSCLLSNDIMQKAQ